MKLLPAPQVLGQPGGSSNSARLCLKIRKHRGTQLNEGLGSVSSIAPPLPAVKPGTVEGLWDGNPGASAKTLSLHQARQRPDGPQALGFSWTDHEASAITGQLPFVLVLHMRPWRP